MSTRTKWIILTVVAVAGWWWWKNRSADKGTGTGAETNSAGPNIDPLLTSPVNPSSLANGAGLAVNNAVRIDL